MNSEQFCGANLSACADFFETFFAATLEGSFSERILDDAEENIRAATQPKKKCQSEEL